MVAISDTVKIVALTDGRVALVIMCLLLVSFLIILVSEICASSAAFAECSPERQAACESNVISRWAYLDSGEP